MAYINSKKILSVVQTKFLPAVYQSKTITPSNFQRVVTADNGYAALESVKIDGILVDPHTEIESVTDATTAYQKSVPAGALSYAGVNSLGGMSYKCENLKNLPNNTLAGVGAIINRTPVNLPAGTYSISFNWTGGGDIAVICEDSSQQTINTLTLSNVVSGRNSGTFTLTSTAIYIRAFSNNTSGGTISDIMLNKGSQALPYQPYFDGIRDSAVTSLVGAETVSIPSEIQALNGYGWGVNDTCYNYIDYERKVFVQKVGRVLLKDLTFTMITVAEGNLFRATLNGIKSSTLNMLILNYTVVTRNTRTNKTIYCNDILSNTIDIIDNDYNSATDFVNHFSDNNYLYYELATPIETDISQYIDTDIIEVAANGSLTFNNTYEQAVPSSITYLVEV